MAILCGYMIQNFGPLMWLTTSVGTILLSSHNISLVHLQNLVHALL